MWPVFSSPLCVVWMAILIYPAGGLSRHSHQATPLPTSCCGVYVYQGFQMGSRGEGKPGVLAQLDSAHRALRPVQQPGVVVQEVWVPLGTKWGLVRTPGLGGASCPTRPGWDPGPSLGISMGPCFLWGQAESQAAWWPSGWGQGAPYPGQGHRAWLGAKVEYAGPDDLVLPEAPASALSLVHGCLSPGGFLPAVPSCTPVPGAKETPWGSAAAASSLALPVSSDSSPSLVCLPTPQSLPLVWLWVTSNRLQEQVASSLWRLSEPSQPFFRSCTLTPGL